MTVASAPANVIAAGVDVGGAEYAGDPLQGIPIFITDDSRDWLARACRLLTED